ncbi:MAG: vitamin K epoxide reductase family protein [Cyanobacteria bacterium P01_F01_bin.150]
MRRRRQQLPWIQRNSRFLLGAIASIGAIGTAYLTYIKLSGDSAACPISGCNQVLSSPYATVFGLPLTLFGFLAYASMVTFALAPLAVKEEANKALRSKLDNISWLFLFIGASAMTVFSGYLMYILTTEIQAACIYCIGSAVLSLSLLTITLIGRAWDDFGQLVFTGFVVFMVTLVGTLGVYSGITSAGEATGGQVVADNAPPLIATTSGPSEIALAQHLQSIGAKKFGAYWCPHCHDQQALFGQEAFSYIEYVECAPDGYETQTGLCQSTGITGFPTWEINGELYDGVQPLTALADISGYTGPRDFQN